VQRQRRGRVACAQENSCKAVLRGAHSSACALQTHFVYRLYFAFDAGDPIFDAPEWRAKVRQEREGEERTA